jgi:hypothetical protein
MEELCHDTIFTSLGSTNGDKNESK